MTCCGAYTSKVLANVVNIVPRHYFSLTRMEHFSVFFPTLSLKHDCADRIDIYAHLFESACLPACLPAYLPTYLFCLYIYSQVYLKDPKQRELLLYFGFYNASKNGLIFEKRLLQILHETSRFVTF